LSEATQPFKDFPDLGLSSQSKSASAKQVEVALQLADLLWLESLRSGKSLKGCVASLKDACGED
jgi:hypothetical protein